MTSARPMTEEELRPILKEAFADFADPATDSLNVDALGGLLRALGQAATAQEIALLLELADADHSQTLSYPEFELMMMRKLNDETTAGDRSMLFATFDFDGDGKISAKDLERALELATSGDHTVATPANAEAMVIAATGDKSVPVDSPAFHDIMRACEAPASAAAGLRLASTMTTGSPVLPSHHATSV